MTLIAFQGIYRDMERMVLACRPVSTNYYVSCSWHIPTIHLLQFLKQVGIFL